MRTAALVMTLLSSTALAATEPAADLVLRGGDILTQDRARPHAHAVAIRGGRIVAVGDDAAVAALVGARTRVIELAGRAAVPALTDAHAHLVSLGLESLHVDLRGCSSPADCAARLVPARGRGGAGVWLRGRGWDQNRFATPVFPTHDALDGVVPDRPVWLERVDGHAGWANRAALTRAGITRATA